MGTVSLSASEEDGMERKERFFSVELKSKADLKNITLRNGNQENALIEGTIGQLEHAEFTDDVVLEVVGDKGVLRVSLTQHEIRKRAEEVKKV